MNQGNGEQEISTREKCMPDRLSRVPGSPGAQALRRLFAEVREGLRHGHFEYTVTCEVVSGGRRRLQVHAGKTYQFDIPAEECKSTE